MCWRASIVTLFPQRAILALFGRYAIHGYACHVTIEALLNHRCCQHVSSTALLVLLFHLRALLHGLRRLCLCSGADNIDSQRVLQGLCDKRAMDGATPELNPGWVHRRKKTYPEVRHTPIGASTGIDVKNMKAKSLFLVNILRQLHNIAA